MLKHLSAVGEDAESNPMRAQQLKHINKWIESVGKYAQEITPHKSHNKKDAAKKHEHSSHQRPSSDKKSDHKSVLTNVVRPTSPKPITSTPPNVHKPLALNHASPETVSNTPQPQQQQQQQQQHQQQQQQQQQDSPHSQHHHSSDVRSVVNYENQGQTFEAARHANSPECPDKECPKTSSIHIHSPDNDHKKSSQFSLVSWLKRDQGKKLVDENASQSQDVLLNTKSSGKPFGKLRSSVAQKLSSSSNIKRQQDNRASSNAQTSSDLRTTIQNEKELEMIQQSSDKEPPLETSSPLSTLRKEHRRDYQNCYYDSQNSGDQIYSSAPSTLGSTYGKDFTPTKYELSRSVRQRQDSGVNQQYSHSKELPHDGDRNSNTAKTSPQSRGRDRAPIALGSNMSISDAYGKTDPETAPQNYENDVAESRNVMNNVDSKWVKATAVPVYKAKLIPNYENQMKIDPRLEHQVAIKGKAEPAVSAHHNHQNSSTSKEHRDNSQRKTTSHVHQASTTSQEYREMLQKTSEVYLSGGYQSVQNIQRQSEEHPTDSSRSRSNRRSVSTRRSVSAGNLPDRRSEPAHPAPVYAKPLASSDKKHDAKSCRERGPTNAQSITSLIERFEKNPEDEGTKNADYESQFQNNPVSMTSTPVMHRKVQQQNHHQYQLQREGMVSAPAVPHRNQHQNESTRGLSQYHSRKHEDYKHTRHDYESPPRPSYSSSSKDAYNPNHRSGHSSQYHPKQQQHRQQQQQQQFEKHQYEQQHCDQQQQQQQQQQHDSKISTLHPQQQYDRQASNFQSNYGCYESHNNYDNMHMDYKTQPSHNHPTSSSSTDFYSGYKSTPPGPPPPKPAHTQHSSGPPSDNYTDQLRKAFVKPKSVFDRHSKTTSHFGHQGSPGAMAVVKPTIIHQGAVEI